LGVFSSKGNQLISYVIIMQTVLGSVRSSSDDIICLESLKYIAPGAWMVSRTTPDGRQRIPYILQPRLLISPTTRDTIWWLCSKTSDSKTYLSSLLFATISMVVTVIHPGEIIPTRVFTVETKSDYMAEVCRQLSSPKASYTCVPPEAGSATLLVQHSKSHPERLKVTT